MLSASFQLCLASSHVISLTCALCLVLINILLKRVKRSSWFTSAKTRGHLVELVSPLVIYFRNLLAKTSLFVTEMKCFWNRETQKIHKVWVYSDTRNSCTWQQLCFTEATMVRAGRAENRRTEPKLRYSFHTTFPVSWPEVWPLHTFWRLQL